MGNCIKTIYVEQVRIDEISVLFVYDQNKSGQKSIVYLFHKILENKEHELPLAYILAKRGYFVVLMDMHGHGARVNSFDISRVYDFNHIFTDINLTAKDIGPVTAYLQTKNKLFDLNFQNITCVGLSIGANVALCAGYMYFNVTQVAALLGSYDWEYSVRNNLFASFRFFSVDRQVIRYEKVKNDIRRYHPIQHYKEGITWPRILFMNGTIDMAAPVNLVKKSFDSLYERYAAVQKQQQLSLRLYPKTGHKISNQMVDDLLQWFTE
jgi:acetyl esterase/lipase|nr:prolyl oligopeptidase family serine peptidase [Ruminococcus bromii]